MIPCIYPIVGLSLCLAALLMYFSMRELGRFGTCFSIAFLSVACLLDFMWAGDKPTPPPPPPPKQDGVTISLIGSTISNVTIKVVCTTNEIALTKRTQARRRMMLENIPVWSEWEAVDEPDIILSTNEVSVISGCFVNERRDTQIRVMYGNGDTSNEVTP